MPVNAEVTVRDGTGARPLHVETHTGRTGFDLTNALNGILVRAGYYTGGNTNLRVTVDVFPSSAIPPPNQAFDAHRAILERGLPIPWQTLFEYENIPEVLLDAGGLQVNFHVGTPTVKGTTLQTTDEMIRQLGEEDANNPQSENNG